MAMYSTSLNLNEAVHSVGEITLPTPISKAISSRGSTFPTLVPFIEGDNLSLFRKSRRSQITTVATFSATHPYYTRHGQHLNVVEAGRAS
jgi:ribosomal protein L31